MKLFWYSLSKVAAAATTMLLLIAVLFVMSDFRISDVYDHISSLLLWLAFFGYGIGSSLVVDAVFRRFRLEGIGKHLLAYMGMSFLLWLVAAIAALFTESDETFLLLLLIAGSVTTLCAWAFYGVSLLVQQRRSLTVLCSAVPLFVMLLIYIVNPAIKQGWQEERTANAYEASFGMFNGKVFIPFEVKEAGDLRVQLNWDITNGGGYGYTARDAEGNGIMYSKEDQDYLDIPRAGTYYLVLRGHNARGKVRITWGKEE